ncbi:cytosolic Fe-S cluster assembly factor Nar1p [Trichomonascus vanleenenianus]|uniref:iron-sulfur cluster assembly protein NAR1 n=1 Tax=Trichomonascus vanleenenianus TaxID=2268995 RepID=UPI003ECB81C3
MSAILSSEDLNDFISPGVACIKPVEIKKTQETAEIEIGQDGEAFEVTRDGEKQSLEAAQISLTDCLACSGCITSAESVLVSMQSHKEVLASVRSPLARDKVFVASVSHQVRASLAAAYGISVEEADFRIKHVLVNLLGFRYVVGLEVGRAIALEYGAREVVERKGSGQTVLCSSCPGWTCYVEKTHPHVIPYLSKVKSPQQITGSILKRLVCEEHGVAKENVYHLSIMPCFDKKLEASRPEFEKEVDCVITTKEVVQLLLDENVPFEDIAVTNRDHLSNEALAPHKWPQFDGGLSSWASNAGSSTGGYLDHVLSALRQAALPAETEIRVVPGRNVDTVDYLVVDSANPDKILAKAARVYGFRNIQNLVRKLKQTQKGPRAVMVRRARRTEQAAQAADTAAHHTSAAYDYVEVMACPGGCINGGGQIGRPDSVSDKEWRAHTEKLYESMPSATVTTSIVDRFVSGVDIPRDALVYTDFHAVEKATDPAAIAIGTKW